MPASSVRKPPSGHFCRLLTDKNDLVGAIDKYLILWTYKTMVESESCLKALKASSVPIDCKPELNILEDQILAYDFDGAQQTQTWRLK